MKIINNLIIERMNISKEEVKVDLDSVKIEIGVTSTILEKAFHNNQVAKVKNLASGYNQGFSPLLCSLGGSDQGSIGCHPGTLEHFSILDH